MGAVIHNTDNEADVNVNMLPSVLFVAEIIL